MAEARFRRMMMARSSAAKNGIPTPIPTPMPIFAPDDRPDVPSVGDAVCAAAPADVAEAEPDVGSIVGDVVGLKEMVPPGVEGRLAISYSVDCPLGFRISGAEALQVQSGSFCIAVQLVWCEHPDQMSRFSPSHRAMATYCWFG